MMNIWILIVWFNIYQPFVTMQEFNDQQACLNAVNTIRNMDNKAHIACVPKTTQGDKK